jgi:hypothetical protein
MSLKQIMMATITSSSVVTVLFTILNVSVMKTFEFTDEQIQLLALGIRTVILNNRNSKEEMLKICGETIYTKEIAKDLDDGVVRLQTLLNYITA